MTVLPPGRASTVAPLLLGWHLATEVDGALTSVRITEVEAYERDDPASHSFRGPTRANRSMFRDPGTLYVYRSYGIHWCANVVTAGASAVLLRAGDPIAGAEVMAARRGRSDHLADGPGKLTQALAITGHLDGLGLLEDGPVWLEPGAGPVSIAITPRIGITRATDLPWRFAAGPFTSDH
jgi:DNA-3-methyladenine glycosylase